MKSTQTLPEVENQKLPHFVIARNQSAVRQAVTWQSRRRA